MNSPRHSLSVLLLYGLLLLIPNVPAQAGSATWRLNPASSDWNKAGNWTPNTVPNGSADVATFGTSNTTAVSILADTEVAQIIFNPGASAFTISTSGPALTISGAGVVNNSGIEQNFAAALGPGLIQFTNSATAGDATYTQTGIGGSGTVTQFFATSNAGTATFINQGGSSSTGGELFFDSSTAANAMFFNHPGIAGGGVTNFLDNSNAGNATFICDGGSSSAPIGGFVAFYDDSSAANASFVANGAETGGRSFSYVAFYENSTAANATLTANGGTAPGALGAKIYFSYITGASTAGNADLIANGGTNGGKGGTIHFEADSLGETARVQIFGNGRLKLNRHNAPGVSVGSIEGDGTILLGMNNLTVGTNNLDTTFAGKIRKKIGPGSFTKTGNGTLILTNSNTYTGGTTVAGGTLFVRNTSGSGTGTGQVQIDRGILGGNGTIAGAVTVGSRSAKGAFLSPGQAKNKPAVFTLLSTLTFNANGNYRCDLNSDTASSDEVFANGLTINTGSQFLFADAGATTLTPGIVLIVINNTAATSITGTFANLPDGSTITLGSNTFQANYEGGDGNDLTLTVVP